MRAYNFGPKGSSPIKLYHVMCRLVGVLIPVQLFFGGEGTAPFKIWEGKKRPKFGAT